MKTSRRSKTSKSAKCFPRLRRRRNSRTRSDVRAQKSEIETFLDRPISDLLQLKWRAGCGVGVMRREKVAKCLQRRLSNTVGGLTILVQTMWGSSAARTRRWASEFVISKTKEPGCQ